MLGISSGATEGQGGPPGGDSTGLCHGGVGERLRRTHAGRDSSLRAKCMEGGRRKNRSPVQLGFLDALQPRPVHVSSLSWRAQRRKAGKGGQPPVYFEAVQKAYYQQARNPSETETLLELAGEIGLDESRFAAELRSPETEQRLQDQFSLRRRLGIRQFPSLVLGAGNKNTLITKGYSDFDTVMAELVSALCRPREFTPP